MRRLLVVIWLAIAIIVSIYCICILDTMTHAEPAEHIILKVQGEGKDFPGQVWAEPVIPPQMSFIANPKDGADHEIHMPKPGIIQCSPVKVDRKALVLQCEGGVVLRLEGIAWR